MVKNEHYVLRFYLSKFATNNKIYAYDLENNNFFHTNINKIGCNNYFYDIDSDSLKESLKEYKEIYNITDEVFEKECEDIQFIEKALSRLEDKFSVLLAKFETDHSIINDEEFLRTLFLFLHAQSIRTKGFRDRLENIANQTKEWLQKLNIKNIDYPIDLEAKDIAKLNQIKELLSLSKVYRKALSFFDVYDIYIGINNTDTDFIISDNPMSYFFAGFNDICFPVNPKLAIIMQVKDAKDEFKICSIKPDKNKQIFLTKKEVIKYNVLQQYSNSKYLLGSEKAIKDYILYMNFFSIINIIRNGSGNIE